MMRILYRCNRESIRRCSGYNFQPWPPTFVRFLASGWLVNWRNANELSTTYSSRSEMWEICQERSRKTKVIPFIPQGLHAKTARKSWHHFPLNLVF
jgi:hypothetical protein